MKTHIIGFVSKNWGTFHSACGAYYSDITEHFSTLTNYTNPIDCKLCLRDIQRVAERKLCCLNKTCWERSNTGWKSGD